MDGFKLLIDTNVLIGLEDARPVQASLAELVRLSSEYAVGLFVDGANYDDVARDRDDVRRSVTLSKLAKFQKLRGVPTPNDATLVARFGSIKNANDQSDVRLLVSLDAKAIDFLVTQDNGLHRRAERAGVGANVLTVEDALQWLKQTFTSKSVILPYVVERKAYEINQEHAIFSSLRADYPEFDKWFEKCKRQHRDCWVLEVGKEIAGLLIRKDETHSEAGTSHLGPKILKICTFKVENEFQGEKFGELLLKQVLWFAQCNNYDLTYVTAYPKHAFLIDLLEYYGFNPTIKLANGETVFEKPITKGTLPSVTASTFDFDRANYPRFYEGSAVRKFCVPIKPDYHRRLFPEIAFTTDLPLFPTETFGPLLAHGQQRMPGNTIRKVYLCRAKITRLRPGDLIFFYMSKDDRYAASQSITTVGIVEQVINVTGTDDLIRHTAKRSVFSAEDLREMNPSASSPVKMIDFLLVGHTEPAVRLDELVNMGVFLNRPPQSIAELTEEKYALLKSAIQLGFEI
jgi:ribosomal protein S18 acetylase RimI-like enzyme